eukprot:10639699-Prorocentrum_lima.AAC.1
MCIRDRHGTTRVADCQATVAGQACRNARYGTHVAPSWSRLGGAHARPQPVSYTHLTLPTICSV